MNNENKIDDNRKLMNSILDDELNVNNDQTKVTNQK
jgi:hypothetical protein